MTLRSTAFGRCHEAPMLQWRITMIEFEGFDFESFRGEHPELTEEEAARQFELAFVRPYRTAVERLMKRRPDLSEDEAHDIVSAPPKKTAVN